MDGDSLQRIAAAVTPAVMVSACGLLALGLDNQAARMSARVREMAREHRELPEGNPRRALVEKQVDILARRHAMLTRALKLNYAALLTFVLTSLLYLGLGLFGLSAAAPLTSFALGVGMLGAMAILVLASLRLSRAAITLEKDEVLRGPR